MKLSILFVGVGIIALFHGCVEDPQPLPVLGHKLSDIQKQTFDRTCTAGCHSDHPPEITSALLWLTADSAYNQLTSNRKIENDSGRKYFKGLVVPGKPNESFLIKKLLLSTSSSDADFGERMPQRLTKLPQNEIDAIIAWINEGAPNN